MKCGIMGKFVAHCAIQCQDFTFVLLTCLPFCTQVLISLSPCAILLVSCFLQGLKCCISVVFKHLNLHSRFFLLLNNARCLLYSQRYGKESLETLYSNAHVGLTNKIQEVNKLWFVVSCNFEDLKYRYAKEHNAQSVCHPQPIVQVASQHSSIGITPSSSQEGIKTNWFLMTLVLYASRRLFAALGTET